jgi:hypothetical protein
MTRNSCFGATGAVLARLSHLCGADYAIVGAFGGTLFESDQAVHDNIEAVRGACGGARAGVAVLGGGVGPSNAVAQIERASGSGSWSYSDRPLTAIGAGLRRAFGRPPTRCSRSPNSSGPQPPGSEIEYA